MNVKLLPVLYYRVIVAGFIRFFIKVIAINLNNAQQVLSCTQKHFFIFKAITSNTRKTGVNVIALVSRF